MKYIAHKYQLLQKNIEQFHDVVIILEKVI